MIDIRRLRDDFDATALALARRGVRDLRFAADEARTRSGFSVETLP